MTETLVAVEPSKNADDKAAAAAIEVPDSRVVDELEVARQLVRQARDAGLALTGPDGLLKAITKTEIETALSEHLGYEPHDPQGVEVATPATEPAPRRCSPMPAGRWRSRSRGIERARTSPRSSRTASGA
jgi:hypothetical protein